MSTARPLTAIQMGQVEVLKLRHFRHPLVKSSLPPGNWLRGYHQHRERHTCIGSVFPEKVANLMAAGGVHHDDASLSSSFRAMDSPLREDVKGVLTRKPRLASTCSDSTS